MRCLSKLGLFSTLLASALLSSCVSTKNVSLSAQDRAAMKGRTVAVSQRDVPAFAVTRSSQVMTAALTGPIGGAVVGGMAAKDGAERVRKHRLTAPEAAVAPTIAKTLVSRTGARLIPSTATVQGFDAKKIAASFPQADYVLDVGSTAWMGIYYPTAFSKYRILHGMKMQLIERSSGRVVATGFHSYQGNDKEHAPDFEGIYANDAAFLKAETKKSTDGAISTFSALF